MRFRLSTLLLATACIALAIGWIVDRYTHRVPSYEERLADHARLAATLTDVNRLHTFSDHPQGYINRVPDMLFIVFIDLYRNRHLFSRTYGPIGNARHIDGTTLHWLGNETLRRINITDINGFEAKLAASGLGAPQYYDLYSDDGSLEPELATFVSKCFDAPKDPPMPQPGG